VREIRSYHGAAIGGEDARTKAQRLVRVVRRGSSAHRLYVAYNGMRVCVRALAGRRWGALRGPPRRVLFSEHDYSQL
jgi:hypothetical protein